MCVKRTVYFSNGEHIELILTLRYVSNYIEIFPGVKSVTAQISLIQKNKRVNGVVVDKTHAFDVRDPGSIPL